MGDPTHDVWAFDSFGPNKARLTFDGTVASEATWSPDGSHFAVVLGLPNNVFRVVVRSSSGSGESTTVQELPYNEAATDWSPDGRYLLTERTAKDMDTVAALPLQPGEAPRTLVPSSPNNGPQSSAQFSPDGRFVALTITLNSGPQIFVVPFSGGSGMWQVSTTGGKWARWSRDGKRIYFVSIRDEMTAVDVHEKGDSVEIGHPTTLFSFHPSLRIYRMGMIGFDVSPDGKRFLLVTAADENTHASRELAFTAHG